MIRRAYVPWLALVTVLMPMMVSWWTNGIVATLLAPDLPASERMLLLQEYFQKAGLLAPFAYVMFVIAEVIVAPVPGLMLYAPGGMMFGPWMGGILAIIGNTIGAGISCALARNSGGRWIETISRNATIEKLQGRLERRGFWLILLLRLNPLTSCDLLSYAAGLTRVPVWKVMLATGVGITPLCLLQSWLSDGIFNRWPALIWPLLLAGVIYLVIVAAIISRLLKTPLPEVETDS